GSPWERLYELDALYIFFGVTTRYCTMLHFVQGELCRQILDAVPVEKREHFAGRLRDWKREGVWPDFDFQRMGEYLAELGYVRKTTIGAARCLAIRTQDLVRESLAVLKSQRKKWLRAEFIEWWKSAEAAAC
ncbi:MAG: AAC(3) family N-acetyltransferase, partial [Armatimonadetes bacterium]|nr:AAC(3) family N-acetyltransferase [Armatimonadota bacterium]